MVSLKTEIYLVKTFRLILPTALVLMLFWTVEAPDALRNSLLNSLGQNANHLVFFLGIVVIAAMYKFMGIYEKKIFFESRHIKGTLLHHPEN